jgi:DNA recombination protein Rad52
MKDAEKELMKSLDAANIKSRSKGGADLSYLESWFVIAEANRIFGNLGWSRETILLECVSKEKNQNGNHIIGYISKVKVTVDGVIREGVGFGSGIAKMEADAHEGAAKEAESDAGKRALMTFGYPLGLALYDKDKANVNVKTPVSEDEQKAYNVCMNGIERIAQLDHISKIMSSNNYKYLQEIKSELLIEVDAKLQAKENELKAGGLNG